VPTPPANQALPKQEPGTRPARALPYDLHVHGEANDLQGTVELRFRNSGKAGAVFHVRFGDGQTAPRTYTVGAGEETSDTFAASSASYDLSVFGPNGFLRTLAGGLSARSANLTVKTNYDKDSEGIELVIHNHSSSAEKVKIVEAYSGKTTTHHLQPDGTFTYFSQLRKSFGWYDFTVQVDSEESFERQLAGHLETGRDSTSDPAIAGLPDVDDHEGGHDSR
jgi:phospholipase C